MRTVLRCQYMPLPLPNHGFFEVELASNERVVSVQELENNEGEWQIAVWIVTEYAA